MAMTDEKIEGGKFTENLAYFIQKNRRLIFMITGALILIVAGFVVVLSVQDRIRTRALSAVEAFNDRYEVLRFDINESAKEEEVAALLEELSAFAQKTAAFSGARSYALIASIHMDRKNWAEAERNWTLAAEKGKKTYLMAVASFNAGVAAEEQGNIEAAITHYGKSLALADDFPHAPRAQFAIGRLQEEQQNREAALEAYRALMEKWSSETVWVNLANSRIIALNGNT
ncbi:MAG: tetratricopeptide repeat protein [Spirochaetaceae bacterium]|jgi:tetratricopeptide (TPR) repeat protein|nr:tetratricopeptide repeat protein [Spirochaetaceae bacterium]